MRRLCAARAEVEEGEYGCPAYQHKRNADHRLLTVLYAVFSLHQDSLRHKIGRTLLKLYSRQWLDPLAKTRGKLGFTPLEAFS
jgi:hypothetical protein